MDAHTEYATNYVRKCVEVLQSTRADNVGGPWVARGHAKIGQAIAAAFQSSFSCGGARGHDLNYSGPVDTVYLGCWPRDVFDRVGFFDEQLVRNQDDELNLRISRAGGKIWQSPLIRSWYVPRSSLLSLFIQYMQYGYWKVRVIQKHRLPASVRHLVPGAFVGALITLLLASFRWPLAAWGWIGLTMTYLTCNITASVFTARRYGLNLLPILPLVFACCHLAYGYGFLRGVLDFVVLRRGARAAYKRLSRLSSADLSLFC